jgi:hypothetical protein
MASHDGLRLYLGKYAPDEVLKHIFAYGFHLWLGEPLEVWTDIYIRATQRHYRGYSTRRYVTERQLTREAFELVDHDAYTDWVFSGVRPLDEARPNVFWDPYVWLRAHGDEYWRVPAMYGDSIHDLVRQPPLPWTDEDLDDM